jgi:hypothetical protein
MKGWRLCDASLGWGRGGSTFTGVEEAGGDIEGWGHVWSGGGCDLRPGGTVISVMRPFGLRYVSCIPRYEQCIPVHSD